MSQKNVLNLTTYVIKGKVEKQVNLFTNLSVDGHKIVIYVMKMKKNE